MAGHSHWAGIKHKKALVDNKRGKLWSKLSKALMVAARMGGGDLDVNIRLRTAVADARAVSMPKETIERAIKKGTGELDGGNVEEVLYEGYGPGGVAVLCEIMTDNRNRTAPEIRKLFELNGGKLGSSNCVAWMFERKGLVVISQESCNEDQLLDVVLEAGGDDVRSESQGYEVTCEPDQYMAVCEALDSAEIPVISKQVTRIPSNTVALDDPTTRKALRLLELLDDHDDVQNVSANLDISAELMAEIQNG